MWVEVHLVNAFVDGGEGGNPAGVVVAADALSPAQKQAVAAQVGVSETAFVSASQAATVKLEFFTPRRQIAHCGHATIATFSLLRQLGRLGEGEHSKETIDGVRAIRLEADQAFMQQRAPAYTRIERDHPAYAAVLRSLGVAENQLLAGQPLCVVNTGNAFLMAPLADEGTLAALKPDVAAVEALSEALDLVGYYPFTLATRRPGRAAGVRMFAPRYGIDEEAATGTAAGPLACYLHHVLGLPATTVQIEQGWLMQPPSPSVLTARLDVRAGQIHSLMVGGSARAMRVARVEV